MSSSELSTPEAAPSSEERERREEKLEKVIEEQLLLLERSCQSQGWRSVCAGGNRGENEEEEAVFLRQERGGDSGLERNSKRGD